ncbi:RNA-binding protein-defense related 1 isoform 1 [Hibiscus syriacus]|uniref:RNA-binding protein-defense related 1 isoform 1 n=1 Tax=Hibiscus syriacus TaxID=106335 RepID=A0A6A2Z052_HIBSY|nr:uncharacterized protein LOC120153431 [Hibiscus syriacus]KAE8685208.1 RNA-binding protein-defense related 1 isoform 1 [Hibiscus syriacus]
MGIRRSKVVDVSSFLLFEATGDSESGCHYDPAMVDINGEHDDDDHDYDDDAESCSCDTVSGSLPGVREIVSLENKFMNVDGDVDVGDDEDDDDGVVEQMEVQLYKKCCRDDQRVNGVFVAKENKPSSAVSVENSNKTMNEMEKNRLFWEACLAS